MLGYLYTDMKDYSGEVKLHFGLCKNRDCSSLFLHKFSIFVA